MATYEVLGSFASVMPSWYMLRSGNLCYLSELTGAKSEADLMVVCANGRTRHVCVRACVRVCVGVYTSTYSYNFNVEAHN